MKTGRGHRRDITGQKRNRLTALYPTGGKNADGREIWVFKCECGKKFKVSAKSFLSGNTKSCGCWYKDSRKIINKSHGMSYKPIYKSWSDMKSRCTNA